MHNGEGHLATWIFGLAGYLALAGLLTIAQVAFFGNTFLISPQQIYFEKKPLQGTQGLCYYDLLFSLSGMCMLVSACFVSLHCLKFFNSGVQERYSMQFVRVCMYVLIHSFFIFVYLCLAHQTEANVARLQGWDMEDGVGEALGCWGCPLLGRLSTPAVKSSPCQVWLPDSSRNRMPFQRCLPVSRPSASEQVG